MRPEARPLCADPPCIATPQPVAEERVEVAPRAAEGGTGMLRKLGELAGYELEPERAPLQIPSPGRLGPGIWRLGRALLGGRIGGGRIGGGRLRGAFLCEGRRGPDESDHCG